MTTAIGRDLRILFVANLFPPDYTGGAEVINYHTCRGLIEQGVDCSLLVVNRRAPRRVDEKYDHDGIAVHRVALAAGKRRAWTDVFDPAVYRAVAAELRRCRPHLVHIHNVSGASLAPYVACRVQGVPVVNTLHDLWLLCPNNMLYRRDGSFCDPAQNPRGCRQCFREYDFWADIPFRRTIFAALTSNVRFFISPSRALMRLHVAAGYKPERFRLVPHGLGAGGGESTAHAAIQTLLATRSQYRTLVFAGGGIEIKGAGVLIEALPILLRHLDRLRVIVVGTGEERLLAAFRRLAPQVSVLGWVPFQQIGALFAAADLVLVPSTWPENFPLVTLESLKVGTPVVGSDFGGIPEQIEEGVTGYLFPVGNAAALAEKVILHFSRPAYVRQRMRAQCADQVRTHLPFGDHIRGTLQVYREALEGTCAS